MNTIILQIIVILLVKLEFSVKVTTKSIIIFCDTIQSSRILLIF
jgi:hypothetical protein